MWFSFVDELKKGFENSGYEVELLDKNEFSLANGDANKMGLKRCIIMEVGSKYCIINHHDRHYSYLAIPESIMDDENCLAIFQSQYRHAPHHKILPFTYLEQDRRQFLEYRKEQWNPKSKVLHYRANIFARDGRRKRRHLIPLLEDIITPCLTEHPDDAHLEIPRPMTKQRLS